MIIGRFVMFVVWLTIIILSVPLSVQAQDAGNLLDWDSSLGAPLPLLGILWRHSGRASVSWGMWKARTSSSSIDGPRRDSIDSLTVRPSSSA
jgi:hypothetical protein